MNPHYSDAWYHVRQAGRQLRRGLTSTVRTLERTVRTKLGRESESEPEPGRVDRVRGAFSSLPGRR